ncbi:MAG: type VI secretion system tip protein VgrG [Polyangiaceae bacterium]|nr:type VI secretion system tip protein VgrG [Polyangiaceae bacterium]
MSTPDFTFAWEHAPGPEGPWAHLSVVRFTGREEISALYRYEIVLLARAGAEVDPEELAGARATLRIATLTSPPAKLVHGVVVEAEEVGQAPEGVLYRVVLMPPLVRARHRTRCRIFLEKTTREIVTAVLLGDPHVAIADGSTADPEDAADGGFAPALERLCWRIEDPSRIDDVRVRPYCVQYNESDLSLVARLLEEEGVSYSFESGARVCLLVLSDSDQGKARLDPFEPLGPHVPGRHVGAVKLGARLRERRVKLGDYDWRKPRLDLSVEAKGDGDDLFEARWPGRYGDAKSLGEPLAWARLDRLRVEAEYATGEGPCRLLSAGSVFRVEHEQDRHDGEYLVTKLEVRGEQHGVVTVQAGAPAEHPFACRFECARRGRGSAVEASRFRPARVTAAPRIAGSQTAFVTAEPAAKDAEIHVGGPEGAEIGCVRLRFHWDTDEARLAKEPSSCWVRVSQMFAGAGEGALWHPRVGCEVIVDFLDGDPDRPIVTGRVYNGQNRPPGPAAGAATVSLFKSLASPGAGVHNELGFDDTAGREQVKMHAGKDWNSTVGHDRSEQVANDSRSDVGVNRAESTGGDRTTSVKGNNSERVEGEENVAIGVHHTTSIGADQKLSVAANRSISVGSDQTAAIGASRRTTVGAEDSLTVGGGRSVTVTASLKESIGGRADLGISGDRTVAVAGASAETVSGSRSVTVSGALAHTIAGAVTLSGAADIQHAAGASFGIASGAAFKVAAGGDASIIAAAEAVLQGANVHVTGAGEIVLSAGGGAIKIGGGGVEITGSSIKLAGGSVDITGNPVKIN